MANELVDYKDFDISTEIGYKEMQDYLSGMKPGVDYVMREDTFKNYVDGRVIQRIYTFE